MANNAKVRETKIAFQAANGSSIATYGQLLLTLNLGLRRPLPWVFTIAEVNKPILGTDFLAAYDLSINVRKMLLIDNKTNVVVNTGITNISVNELFPCLKPVHDYQGLLKRFPEILKFPNPSERSILKHGVSHAIVTQSQPVCSRPRRLTPDKEQAVRAEFNFMVQQGICRPFKSPWASPLHLVSKKNGDWQL